MILIQVDSIRSFFLGFRGYVGDKGESSRLLVSPMGEDKRLGKP